MADSSPPLLPRDLLERVSSVGVARRSIGLPACFDRRHPCLLHVSSATGKLPGMPTNPAETTEAGEPTKVGLSDDFSREKIDRRISVAPMRDWTDDRRFCLCISHLHAPESACLLYVSSKFCWSNRGAIEWQPQSDFQCAGIRPATISRRGAGRKSPRHGPQEEPRRRARGRAALREHR